MDDVVIPHRAHDSHSHELSHTGDVALADIIKADFTLIVGLTKDVMITK